MRFKSLRQFVRDGMWASVAEGTAETHFSAYAVALAASPALVGWIISLQQLASCWLQLWSGALVRAAGGRKRFVLICVGIQTAALAAMAAGALSGAGLLEFASLAIIYSAAGGLSGPAWNAWVGDLLPARRRGACFSVRNRRVYPASFLSIVLTGLWLEHSGAPGGLAFSRLPASAPHAAGIAFFVVFLAAWAAKLFSLRQLSLQQVREPEPEPCNAGPGELLSEGLRDPAMRKTLGFFAAMSFAVNLSGPLMVPFLLDTLKLGYARFAIVSASMVAARFVAAPIVGRIVDVAGTRRLLLISSVAMPLIPLSWALFPNWIALVAFQLAAGFVWTAYDLCSFTLLVEQSRPEERHRWFALRQLSSGLAAFAGAAIGASIAQGPGGIILALWASALARAGAAALGLRAQQPANLINKLI